MNAGLPFNLLIRIKRVCSVRVNWAFQMADYGTCNFILQQPCVNIYGRVMS